MGTRALLLVLPLLFLAGCVADSSAPSEANATTAPSPTPLRFEFIVTSTPQPTPTVTAAPTPTPVPTSTAFSCSVTATPNAGAGSFLSTITATFANLPAGVTTAIITCLPGGSAMSAPISGNTATRECVYDSATTTTHTVSVQAGSVTCLTSVTAGPGATPTPTLSPTALPASTVDLFLNSLQNHLNAAWNTTVNVSAFLASGSGTLALYINHVAVANPLFPNLTAGTYNVTANTTATTTHASGSKSFNLTIAKAEGNATLFLNASRANYSAQYGVNNTVNVSGSTLYGTLTFYVDGVASGNSSFLATLGAGTHYITANSSGDANHSTAADALAVTVNPQPSTAFVQLNNSNPPWDYANNTGVTVGAWCTDPLGTVFAPSSITRNGTGVANQSYFDLNGTAGLQYNFTTTCSDANHTASQASGLLTVTCGPGC